MPDPNIAISGYYLRIFDGSTVRETGRGKAKSHPEEYTVGFLRREYRKWFL